MEKTIISERAKQIEQIAVLSIIALLIIGSIVIILPFLRAILWGLVFAVTVWPFFIRVEKALRGRRALAAAIPTLLFILIFFLPLVYVSSKVVSRAPIALDYAQGLMEKGLGPPPSWLKGLPLVGVRLDGAWREMGQNAPRLIEVVKPYIKDLLSSTVSAGAGVGRFVLLMVLSLIIFFFFLKEGHAIRSGLERMAVRLAGEKGRHLLFVAGSTMRSVVYGILGAAIVQGIMAIFGLWISGVPNPVFVGMVAGLFALIPIGLIQVILLPAAGWLIFFKGQIGWGIFLAIWSFTVIGNIDNFIRPMLISRGAKVPFLVVLLGVLGGLASGGIIGLFVGATLLSVFYTLLKEWIAVEEDNSGAGQTLRDRSGAAKP
jgi:predicted PurR-regulated permease PerM